MADKKTLKEAVYDTTTRNEIGIDELLKCVDEALEDVKTWSDKDYHYNMDTCRFIKKEDHEKELNDMKEFLLNEKHQPGLF